jgi:hypothetical protein
MTPEQARQAAYGPWDFHSEKWELAYVKRIDATIAALKSAGVPVIWVGLASQRGTKSSQDSSYLNELYRSRADKAGIIYVDIWDGFVDESGRYSPQGPDYEGQIRRLRTGDGVYFTKFGARKLAHYVEREVQRIVGNKGLPVALPVPLDPANRRMGQSAGISGGVPQNDAWLAEAGGFEPSQQEFVSRWLTDVVPCGESDRARACCGVRRTTCCHSPPRTIANATRFRMR